jgi:ATP-dependent Zn protease
MGAAKLKKVTTAWHEAGHIVMGMHFGFRLTEASITPRHTDEGTFWGRTEWAPIGGTLDAIPAICMALAGGIAEEKWSGISDRWHGDDFANIWALAWVYLARTETFTPHASVLIRLTATYRRQPERVPANVKALADEMIAEAAPETRRILNENWREVERVAGLLLKHRVVTPELMGTTSL